MSTLVQKQDLNSRIFVVVSVAAQSSSDDRRKQVQFRKQNLSSEKILFFSLPCLLSIASVKAATVAATDFNIHQIPLKPRTREVL